MKREKEGHHGCASHAVGHMHWSLSTSLFLVPCELLSQQSQGGRALALIGFEDCGVTGCSRRDYA